MPARQHQSSLIGPSDAAPATLAAAETIGRGIAQRGLTLITGGWGGVMQAASRCDDLDALFAALDAQLRLVEQDGASHQ